MSGSNLAYNASSDQITMSWQTTDAESGETTDHSVAITPESSGYSAMILPAPTALVDVPVGTVVTFTFFLRQGDPATSVMPATAKAKIASAA